MPASTWHRTNRRSGGLTSSFYGDVGQVATGFALALEAMQVQADLPMIDGKLEGTRREREIADAPAIYTRPISIEA